MNSLDLIEEHFIKRLAREEYLQLKNDAKKYALNETKYEEFFSSIQGYRVLCWTVNMTCDYTALNFLCDNIQAKFLEKALSFKKFAIFKTFLKVECDVEYDADEVDNLIRIEKLKLLLKISPIGLKEFMKTHQKKTWMTKFMLENYHLALNE